MASTRSIQKLYDKLGTIQEKTLKVQTTAHLLQGAVAVSLPAVAELNAAAIDIARKVGCVPIEELRSEIAHLMKTSWGKLVIAKLATMDAMASARLPHHLLESTFTPERFDIGKMTIDAAILLKCSKQICHVMLLRMELNKTSLGILQKIASGMVERDEEKRIAQEAKSKKETEHPKTKLIGLKSSRLTSKSTQRKEIIISILTGLAPNAAAMAKEITCQLPKSLRVTDGSLRRHELSELSKDGVISNTPGQGYHLKFRS